MGKERDISREEWRLTPPEPVARAAGPSHHADPANRKIFTCRFCGGRWREVDWFLYHPCVQARFRQVVLAELPQDHPNARKCSPLARAKTRNLPKLRLDLDAEKAATGRKYRHPRRLPLVREDCPEARPCGFVSCRHHNAFEEDQENGSIKELYPQFQIYDNPTGPGLLLLEMVVGTCSLDVSDGQDDGSQGVNALQELRDLAEAGLPIANSTANGLTLEETAQQLQISIERVRQLGARAMHSVRVELAARKGPHGE